MVGPIRRAAPAALALLGLGAPAQAAEPEPNNSIVFEGTVIKVTADTGQADLIRISQTEAAKFVLHTRGSTFDTVTGCTSGAPSPAGLEPHTCNGVVTDVVVYTKDRADTIQVITAGSQAQTFKLEAHGGADNDGIFGGDEKDALFGDEGNDSLLGDDGDDLLDGGDDNDVLRGQRGADDFAGGEGFDAVQYFDRPPTEPVRISIDDQANDGAPDERDNVRTSVEDVVGGQGNDTIVGSAAQNVLDGSLGDDVIEGGGGTDRFIGNGGSDHILAADESPERIDCGEDFPATDVDKLTADPGDESGGCEEITVVEPVGSDPDRDGFRRPADCEEGNAAVNPGAQEVPENGVDENCDGADGVVSDRDRDGFGKDVDCDDTNPNARPGNKEVPGNAVDEDCDLLAPPIPVIETPVLPRFSHKGAITRVRALAVGEVPAGATVVVRCTGARKTGCPRRQIKRTVKRRSKGINFLRYYRRAKLRKGAVLEVQITKPGFVGLLVRFRVKPRAVPTPQLLCIEPGAKKAEAC